MAGKSDSLENQILNYLFNGTALTQPTNVWIALYTAAPSDAGGGTEVSGGSYARVQKACNTTNWPSASGGAIANGNAITFPAATASWGVVTHFGIHRHATNDDLMYWGALTASKTVDSGDTVSFATGELDVTED